MPFVLWALLPVAASSMLATVGTQDGRVGMISLVPVTVCCLLVIFCPRQPVWRLSALHSCGFAAGAVAACHLATAIIEPSFFGAAEVFELGLPLQAVFGVIDSAFFATRPVLCSEKRIVQFDFERCALATGSGFGVVWLPFVWHQSPVVFFVMPAVSVVAAWLICATWVTLPSEEGRRNDVSSDRVAHRTRSP
jgi:hypothetical protein